MKPENREEFERRLLALVRDYFDHADANNVYEEAYDVADFIVIFNIVEPPPSDEPLQPWYGGPQGDSRSWVAWTSTLYANWMKEAMLNEPLHMLHRPDDPDDDADKDSDD